MPRYCSHTVILPDEHRLDNFVVEVAGSVTAYYPFAGERHSTIYLDTPILLSLPPPPLPHLCRRPLHHGEALSRRTKSFER